MEIGKLLLTDLVKDKYNNYYEVNGISEGEGKLKGITIGNYFYEKSFNNFIGTLAEEHPERRFTYIGEYLVDGLNQHIKNQTSKGRMIYTIEDLSNLGVEIKIKDITQLHIKALKQKR